MDDDDDDDDTGIDNDDVDGNFENIDIIVWPSLLWLWFDKFNDNNIVSLFFMVEDVDNVDDDVGNIDKLWPKWSS